MLKVAKRKIVDTEEIRLLESRFCLADKSSLIEKAASYSALYMEQEDGGMSLSSPLLLAGWGIPHWLH